MTAGPKDIAENVERLAAKGDWPLRAIRRFCIWCCNGSTNEVRLCPATSCPLWGFRFGRKPTPEMVSVQATVVLYPLEDRMTGPEFYATGLSSLSAIKRKCLDCSSFSKAELRSCAFHHCALHQFRQGNNPRRAYQPDEKARRAEQLRTLRDKAATPEKPVSISDPQTKKTGSLPEDG